jgi:hypothetical protein
MGSSWSGFLLLAIFRQKEKFEIGKIKNQVILEFSNRQKSGEKISKICPDFYSLFFICSRNIER